MHMPWMGEQPSVTSWAYQNEHTIEGGHVENGSVV